jgi:hypothetical protein
VLNIGVEYFMSNISCLMFGVEYLVSSIFC